MKTIRVIERYLIPTGTPCPDGTPRTAVDHAAGSGELAVGQEIALEDEIADFLLGYGNCAELVG